MARKRKTEQERFFALIRRTLIRRFEGSTHWIWQGGRKGGREGDEYSAFAIKRRGKWKTELGHRWSYREFIGSIPRGALIHHRCGVQLCVNPDHLEAVNRGDNVALA